MLQSAISEPLSSGNKAIVQCARCASRDMPLRYSTVVAVTVLNAQELEDHEADRTLRRRG
jgi:hypothetical protein